MASSSAVELAQGYVSLSISTVNMGKQIIKGFALADVTAAATGKSSGAKFAKAFDTGLASAGNGIEALQKKLAAAAEAGAKQVTAARRLEEAAARKVAIEEQKLSEIRDAGKAKASQILTAEDKLAGAQLKLALAADKTTAATRKMNTELDDTGTELKQAEAAATKSGKGFDGLKAKIKTALNPATKGAFGNISKAATTEGDKSGKNFGSAFGTSVKKLVGVAALAGVGLAVSNGLKGAVGAASTFQKSINLVGVTSGETGKGLQQLTDLALDMGAKTTFSAQGASDAMVELAKGGLTAAQIKAGALQSTLTLATAGGLSLGDAATFMVQGLTGFGLAADKSSTVAAALAGGANASTASVESLGIALGQVGPGAKLAGLSMQDTVAALAAFDNAGLKGSDAGTSLKTMLTRLVPSTDKAFGSFQELGLISLDTNKAMELLRDNGVKPLGTDSDVLNEQLHELAAKLSGTKNGTDAANKEFAVLTASTGVLSNKFFDAQGNIKSLSDVSQILQGALKGQTKEQKIATLNTLFGSDATRAAAVLADNGAKGLAKYVTAVNDQSQAEALAANATKGFAGAKEALGGGIETLQIQVGTYLLPVLTQLMQFITKTVLPKFTEWLAIIGPKLGPALSDAGKHLQEFGDFLSAAMKFIQDNTVPLGVFAGAIAAITAVTAAHTLVLAINSGALKAWVIQTKIVKVATATWAAVQWVLNSSLLANPITWIVIGILALVAGVILAYKNSETFRAIVQDAFAAIKIAAAAVFDFFTKTLWPGIKAVFDAIVGAVSAAVGGIKAGFTAVGDAGTWLWQTILQPVFSAISTAIGAVGAAAAWLYTNGIKPAFDGISAAITAVGNVFMAVWDGFLSPVFQLFGAIINWLAQKIFAVAVAFLTKQWKMLSTGIQVIYQNVIKPVIDFFGLAIKGFQIIFKVATAAIRTAWDAVAAKVRDAYNKTIVPILNFFKAKIADARAGFEVAGRAIRAAWDLVTGKVRDGYNATVVPILNALKVKINDAKNTFNTVKTAIRAAWDSITSKIKSGWDSTVSPVVSALKSAVSGLGKIFETAVAGIKKQWDKLQNIAKVPVKFVINTVVNGLIRGFNKLADVFGTDHIDELVLPKGFEDGGSTGPGPKSKIAGNVHADEHVWTKEEVRKFGGHRKMEAWRAAVRKGTAFDLPGYETGGAVRPVPGGFGAFPSYPGHTGVDFPVGTGTPVHAVMAGVVKAVKHLTTSYGNHVIVSHPNGMETLYAHLQSTLVNPGQAVGAGSLLGASDSTGNSTGAHLHLTYQHPGGNYVDPTALLNGSVASPGGAGSDGDGNFLTDIIADLKAKFSGPINSIKDQFGSNPFVKMITEIPKSVGTSLVNKLKNFATGALDAGKAVAKTASATAWSGVLTTALLMNNLPLSQLDNWIAQVASESGGNPLAVQGNIGDVNNASGDLAKGLLQVIGATFRAYSSPFILPRSQFNPLANAYAAMNYAKHAYGKDKIESVIGHGHGYANGTSSARPGMAWVGERGPELINFNGGERVHTNKESVAMTGGRSFNLYGNLGYDPRELFDEWDRRDRRAMTRANVLVS